MNIARLNAIEQRLHVLEDRAALAELTIGYALAVNQGWEGAQVDTAALPDIFTPDAVWYSRAMGVRAEGLPAIVSGIERGTRATNFAMHSYSNPVMSIMGNEATAKWLLFIASRRHNGPANQVFMEDTIDYLRTGAGWRIKRIQRQFGMELIANASSHHAE